MHMYVYTQDRPDDSTNSIEAGARSQSSFQKLYNEVDHGQEKPNLVHILIESVIWRLKELHP